MTLPDSINRVLIKDNRELNLDNAIQSLASSYDFAQRFDIDTVSSLSPASIALDSKTRALQKKLMGVLPKISLTTGTGEDKFTRNYYIVEGDIKLDAEELYYYCLKRLQKKYAAPADKEQSRRLTVAMDKSGNPSIWPIGLTIKYCIMRSSFSSKTAYDSVVTDMRAAINDWMHACNIRFQYVPDLDRKEIDLDAYPNQILFIVRQFDAQGDFIAQSFFPADLQFKRLLLLDNSFFSSAYSRTGVLRHELGHILGFRHEHIWSTDASCSGESIIEEELGAQPVTKYDPYSVMHYPCGQNKDNFVFALTSFDKEGSLKVYPFSR